MRLLVIMKGFLFNIREPLFAIYEKDVYTNDDTQILTVRVEVYNPSIR